MTTIFGLLGAHRTGKSTLAAAIAKASIFEYVPVSIAEMQKKFGFDSANQNYPWSIRKTVQECLLQSFTDFLFRIHVARPMRKEYRFILDRTPLDLIGYAMLAYPDNPTRQDEEWLAGYISDCIKLTNIHFHKVILVQPGIPLVSSPTSAPLDMHMINKLNQCYQSLLLRNDLAVPTLVIPREVLDLDTRIQLTLGISNES